MFPLVSRDLIEELNRRFPNQSPTYLEEHPLLMWRGGQRSVVDLLQTIHDEQASSQLGE
jgi:hypothetical protein